MTYAAGKIPGGFFKREGRPTHEGSPHRAADGPADPAALPGELFRRSDAHRRRPLGRPRERSGHPQHDRRLRRADDFAGASRSSAPPARSASPRSRTNSSSTPRTKRCRSARSNWSSPAPRAPSRCWKARGARSPRRTSSRRSWPASGRSARSCASRRNWPRRWASASRPPAPPAESPLFSQLEAKYFDRLMAAHQVRGKFARQRRAGRALPADHRSSRPSPKARPPRRSRTSATASNARPAACSS